MTALLTLVKKAVPLPILNEFLLRVPSLYTSGLVNYETNIDDAKGLEDLKSQLRLTFDIEGDIVECGSARGGASVIMAKWLLAHNVQKQIYALDSFAGFDRTELVRERADGLTTAPDDAFTSTSFDYVSRKMEVLGLGTIVKPVQGFFASTLPGIPSPLSFALLDCDLEESLIYCAETVWPKLSRFGRMVVDDYKSDEFRGARLAVRRFLATYADEILDHRLLNRLYLIVKR